MSVHECSFCPFNTPWKFSLYHHKNRHYYTPYTNCSVPLGLYECTTCQFQATEQDIVVEIHQKNACLLKPDQTKDLGKNDEIKSFRTSKKRTFKTVNKVKNSGSYPCDRCPYKARRRDHLQDHVLARHSEWYHCQTCRYKTMKEQHLAAHMAAKHQNPWKGKTVHNCKQCWYKTQSENKLERHVEQEHSSSEKYSENDLQKLSRLKLRVDPSSLIQWYHCDKCPHKNKRKSDLKNHIAVKHMDASAIDWHECRKCSYRSRIRRYLTRHVRRRHRSDS